MKKAVIIFSTIVIVGIGLITIRNTITLFDLPQKLLVDSISRDNKIYMAYAYSGNATTNNFLIVTEVEEGVEKEIKSLVNYKDAKFLNGDTLKIIVWRGAFSNSLGRDTLIIEND